MNEKSFKFWGRGIIWGIGGMIFAAMIALLFGWVLMLLWNWLMPAIFNLPVISYWQGWGLVLLSHLLFKGGGPRMHDFRSPGSQGSRTPHCGDRENYNDFRREFQRKMRERWHDSNPEQGEETEGSPE